MNCVYNSSISIDKYLPEKKLELDWHKTIPLPSKRPGRKSPGESRMVQAPLPSSYTAANDKLLKDWGLHRICPRHQQHFGNTFHTHTQALHLSRTHTSLAPTPKYKTQQPVRQVQATLALQPCKLKQIGKSEIFYTDAKRRLFFLMGVTSTNPPAFAEAITKSWVPLKMKLWPSQLGQPTLESFSFRFRCSRRDREKHPQVPVFSEMLHLLAHIITFKILAGKIMRSGFENIMHFLESWFCQLDKT